MASGFGVVIAVEKSCYGSLWIFSLFVPLGERDVALEI